MYVEIPAFKDTFQRMHPKHAEFMRAVEVYCTRLG
jgi:hypothetical protein